MSALAPVARKPAPSRHVPAVARAAVTPGTEPGGAVEGVTTEPVAAGLPRYLQATEAQARQYPGGDLDPQEGGAEHAARLIDRAATVAPPALAGGRPLGPRADRGLADPASPGRPLDAAVRPRLENATGLDLAPVRVHSDARAARVAASGQAQAVTRGTDIWLGASQRADNLGLMAHEVAHVAQQSHTGMAVQARPENATPASVPAEARADEGRAGIGLSEDEMVSRLQDTPPDGASLNAPSVAVDASTASTLDAVEAESGRDASADGAAPAPPGAPGRPVRGAAARPVAGSTAPVPPGVDAGVAAAPSPMAAFESLVSADVAAYLDGNLSSERMAALDPQTQALLEAADALGGRSITDPDARALEGLGGDGLSAAAPTTGYENEPAWLQTVATIRDVAGQLGGIVGIIGLVATVSGFILSLLMPPVGAFLLTVGRFCDIAALVLDGISLVLGALLTGYNYYRLKNETDPEERRRLLGMVRADAMGTVMSAVAVATAVAPGAGRALGRTGRRMSAGLRSASRVGGAVGRGARAVRRVGLAGRLAVRAGRRGIGSAGRAAATGFRSLSRSSSLAGRAARGLRVGYVTGMRTLGRAQRGVGRTLSRTGVWARGTAPVRWGNRLGGQAEEWARLRLRGLAAGDTAMGRFYNRRLRGIHERNVMLARSLNDPVERAYQLRLGRELSAELDALRQANPGWTPRQLDDALRTRFGRERLGDAQVGATPAGNVQFVRDDARFLREVRETEFTEIQLIRDRLPPGATPRELAEAVNSSPFIKGRWTESELRAFTTGQPTRGATGELALRNAAADALAVSKTGHHTLPASMAPQISRHPRFVQIVNDSRSYRDFIDRAHPGMTHVPPVDGYRVPGARPGRMRQALNRREVIENMLDQGQIPGYTRADIDYFMGRGLADDLVVDGSSGVWRNRRGAGNQTFFNPHLGIGHEWDWTNEVARQVFDMDTRLGLSLRRELGSQLALPAIRQATRTTGSERGGDDGRLRALIDAAIRARTAREQGLSPAASIDALLTPLPADQPLASASTATEPAEAMPATSTAGTETEPAAPAAIDAAAAQAISAEGVPGGPGEEAAVPPSPVPFSPQALVSIREQRSAVAEAIGVVGQYINDADAAEAHNLAAKDTATELTSRNAEQQQFAQAESDTVASEQGKLTQAEEAQTGMAAENERASGEAARGESEASNVQSEGAQVSVEPRPEEPSQRSWLERAWDATAGALWDELVAPAVAAVQEKVNDVMQSINSFITGMIDQALGLDEIEAELDGGGTDIADRSASLDETDAGLGESIELAGTEEERNRASAEQAEANAADAAISREDAQTLLADLRSHDAALAAEAEEGTAYVTDFGQQHAAYFEAQSLDDGMAGADTASDEALLASLEPSPDESTDENEAA